MRDAAQVLLNHEIQGQESCIAWAVEYIAKIHEGVPATDYPIQKAHPSGLGFGQDAIELLKLRKIRAEETFLEWAGFEHISKEDAAKGLPLVFSFPTRVLLTLNPVNVGFGDLDTHAAIALHHPAVAYTSRQFGSTKPTIIPIESLYQFVRAQIKPDYKIHCLRHRPA